MQPLWTVSEVLAATGGRPEGLPDRALQSLTIDSRDIGPDALFVAIRGDTRDGHDFVSTAFAAGAVAALVSEAWHAANGGSGLDRLIVVPDTLKALEAMGRAARARSDAEIVAVTGSVGKTTTKEAMRLVLRAFGGTHASPRSFNNHWGVPLTLARLPREARFGVFEIGMNHAGEITPLTRMVRPHIAVVTTVSAAHLEFFDSVTGIAEAKAEIFLGLEPGGTALLNADHDYLHILFHRARRAGAGRIVTYGFDESADWRIVDVDAKPDRTAATVVFEGERFGIAIPAPGRHMLVNAVAALAVARLVGESTGAAIEALRTFEAPDGRGVALRLGPPGKPLLLIDESYNANVASMHAALDVYAGITPTGGTKTLVLGDMLELGARSAELHAGLADAVRAAGATRIFLVGRTIRALAEALEGEAEIAYAETADGIRESVLGALAHGDSVMVKGSNGVRLAGLVEAIRGRFG